MAESNEVKYLLVRKKGESERASLVAQMVKHLPAIWETQGSIPGLGRSPEIKLATIPHELKPSGRNIGRIKLDICFNKLV